MLGSLLSLFMALQQADKPVVRDAIEVTAPAKFRDANEAASAGVITAEQIARRPLQRPADVLEIVPGVVVSQHSGAGKANQYYLRGFNLDHGTDLAQTVAGAPVNMRTHAHGQGYSDDNFVMPELIGGVRYRKGPYYADAGDFASAGTVDIDYVSALERPLVSLTGGRYGYRRLFTAGSRTLGDGALLGAFEFAHDDGPWLRPDAYRKLNALLRYTSGRGDDAYSVTLSAYDGRWNASDQIPSRAVAEGLSRFGEIDPSDGGKSYRASLAADWERGGATLTKANAYVVAYGLDLFSNFTYFLDDPVHGDQFEQQDRRIVAGGRATHQWVVADRFENLAGVELRYDHIGALGLYHTAARQRLATLRSDRIDESSLGVFAQTTIRWSPAFRVIAGLRADTYRVASIASPKLSAIYAPRDGTELYASAGLGFHSNDFRERETPLARTRGAELGVRTAAIPHVQTTLAFWDLDIGSELVFAGDSGTTEASGASRRCGIESSSTVRLTTHVALDADLAWSRARFRDGNRIPGAVEGVAASGVVLDFGRVTGAVRYRYFGPRPLVENGSVRSRASQAINAETAFSAGPRLKIVVEALNLTNARVSDVDYFYTSRLRGEPVDGITDTHTHPLEPRSLRLRLETRF